MYASLEKFRQLTAFKKGEITDEEINAMMLVADKAVMRMATIEVYDERLSGNIDGSNTIFTTANKLIADRNLDMQINASDVDVYLAAKDAENNRISTATTVSSVSSRDGRIILSSAPTTINAELGVFADYRYYHNTKIDFDMMEEAAIYYLAFLAAVKVDDKMANWSGISDGVLSRMIAGGGSFAGKEKFIGRKWLDLVLRTLGSMKSRGSGKIANRRVEMRVRFRK